MLHRTTALLLFVYLLVPMSCLGTPPDYLARPGTALHALSATDGTRVTLDSMFVDRADGCYLFLRDPWRGGATIPVYGCSDVRKWWTVEVSGTMSTISGYRVLIAQSIRVYTDSKMRPCPPFPKGLNAPWEWPYMADVPIGPSLLSMPPPPPSNPPPEEPDQLVGIAGTIAWAKLQPSGTLLALPGGREGVPSKIVTAIFMEPNDPDTKFLYIQEPGMPGGIKVDSTLETCVQVGDVVDVEGTIGVADGECYIGSARALATGVGDLPNPVHASQRSAASGAFGLQPALYADTTSQDPGSGLSLVGTRVTMSGEVTRATQGNCFYMDDGSGLKTMIDQQEQLGIKVVYLPGTTPDYALGAEVEHVTGVLGVELSDGKPVPVLRVRTLTNPIVDDGVYVQMTNGMADLHAEWWPSDTEDTVDEYRYAIVTNPSDLQYGVTWISAGTSTSVTVPTSAVANQTYYFGVKARYGEQWSGIGVSNGVKPVAIDAGSGWSLTDGGNTISHSGSGTGALTIAYPASYTDPACPGHEYEFSYNVRADGSRASGDPDWPTPKMQLVTNGGSYDSRPFFGDDIERKRRVRFWVEDGQSAATIRFVADEDSVSQTTLNDFRFRPVESVARDTSLGLPYVGYNFRAPPGGGMVDGWTSGYDDDCFRDWLDTAKPDSGLVLRVFMEMDQGIHTFHDDTWRVWPDTAGDPNPNLQYNDDWTLSDGSVPVGHQFPWVTVAGSGYDHDYGFLESYKTRVHQFLSTCDDPDGNPLTRDGVKVIAVLFSGGAFWENVAYKSGVRAKCFRKTVFDKSTDTLNYHDTLSHPKYSSTGAQDHSQMFDNYLVAVEDWLEEFGDHESLRGIDVMNEPSQLGYTGSSDRPLGGRRYCWHALGWDACDGDAVSENHRMREFLEGAYQRVDTYRTQNRRDIRVISDVAWMDYAYPRQYIDMKHPWNQSDPQVYKVCDVFGLHWYPYHNQEDMVQGEPRLSYTNMWSSDRLQPWRCPDEGVRNPNPFPRPITDWMAEKPIILAETCRYVSYDTLAGEDGGYLFDSDWWCMAHNLPTHWDWYPGYLDMGQGRHIQSMVFWSGDGYSRTGHLVLGTSLAPPGQAEGHTYGWGSPYTLGAGGCAVNGYGE